MSPKHRSPRIVIVFGIGGTLQMTSGRTSAPIVRICLRMREILFYTMFHTRKAVSKVGSYFLKRMSLITVHPLFLMMAQPTTFLFAPRYSVTKLVEGSIFRE